VEEIISDAQTVHSLYKYMRKFRAMESNKLREEDSNPFFFVYYLFCNFFFSNGVMDGWNFGRMDEYS
jgi:hypothetical protein